MLALAKRLRDADAEAGCQGEVVRAESQRSEDQKCPESESRDPRPAGSGPELKNK